MVRMSKSNARAIEDFVERERLTQIEMLKPSMSRQSEPIHWLNIETAPRDDVILFFPPRIRNGKIEMDRMIKVGRVDEYPYRKPTYWMPIPADPE